MNYPNTTAARCQILGANGKAGRMTCHADASPSSFHGLEDSNHQSGVEFSAGRIQYGTLGHAV